MFSTVDSDENSQLTSVTQKLFSARDVSESKQDTETEKHQNSRELTVNMLIKELVFCVALALTTYGALHNSPTKVSKHPHPVRFFSTGSPVTDWYRGQLSEALGIINSVDISFVMYYAPWDAECQYVRDEFEKAAQILNDRVHFSAINCWNPGSECRLQHNKIPSWPIIMAYTVNSQGILYKGPRDAHSMVNFLELIMYPLKRVSAVEDLVNLLSVCEAVAVGYTPLMPNSKAYNIWYHVALKMRDFDTIGEICFAAVTSEDLAADLGVESVPTVRFMLWNETKEYDDELEFDEAALTQWLLRHFTQPVARIIPMWRKAFSFEPYVNRNPLLLLFTPLNPLYEQLPIYDLMREISMEYQNCEPSKNQWAMEILKLQQIQRLLYQQKDFKKLCQDYETKKPMKKPIHRYFKKDVLSQFNKYPWHNATDKTHKNALFGFLLRRSLSLSAALQSDADQHSNILFPVTLTNDCDSKILPAEKNYYQDNEHCFVFSEKNDFHEEDLVENYYETTMLPLEDDIFSAESLMNEHVSHFCKLMKFARELGPPVFPAKENSNITHIQGLACAKNFSLSMIAVDSIRNHHFAEALGIDVLNMKDKTAVVILDSRNEHQYVLKEEYSAKSVRDFILNFTNNNLKRTLRTHVEDAIHTHYFKNADSSTEASNTDENNLHVINLTTRTFRKFVRQQGVVNIVLLCGGGCGWSWTLAALGAARLLRAAGVRACAARHDASRYDLPWHFTTHHYPTILVFYAERDRYVLEDEERKIMVELTLDMCLDTVSHSGSEPESVVFPARARVSAAGVAALALRSLRPPHHLRVRLTLCQKAQIPHEKKICLQEVREHVRFLIDRNLKYWRRFDDLDVRNALFQRLKYLHQVSLHLDFLYVIDFYNNSEKHVALLNSLTDLSNNWDVHLSILRKNITDPLWMRTL